MKRNLMYDLLGKLLQGMIHIFPTVCFDLAQPLQMRAFAAAIQGAGAGIGTLPHSDKAQTVHAAGIGGLSRPAYENSTQANNER
jgi:hypothetical protein